MFETAAEPVDVVIVAVGELGSQTWTRRPGPGRSHDDGELQLARGSTVRGRSPIRLQGHGRIIVLSSVAGFRVRRSNFVYGSAKAGLDAFARDFRSSSWHRSLRAHCPSRLCAHQDDGGPAAAPFAVRPERVASDIFVA